MRMTRRVKPPTAAVTMTNTCPWSEAMSDAGGGGGILMGKMGKEGNEGEEPEDCGQREKRSNSVRM